jgi:hypothetical protein
VVVGHRPGPAHRLDPPPGHVALDDADGHRPLAPRQRLHLEAAQRGAGQHEGHHRRGDHHDRDADPAGRRRGEGRLRGSSHQPQHEPGHELADQGDDEGDAGHAHHREEAVQGRVHGGVGDPGPAEATERDAGVGELHADPAAGSGQRPDAEPPDQGQGRAEQAEEQGLEDDEHRRDPDPEHVQPVDRHGQHGEPEQVPEPERQPRPAVPHRQGERRDADEQQRPEAVGLPAQAQRGAGRDDDQSGEQPPPPGVDLVRGTLAGRGGG